VKLPTGRLAIVWRNAKHNEPHQTPCDTCGKLIDTDIHAEEFGLCIACSNAYFTHDDE
jgi:hypothetical protein